MDYNRKRKITITLIVLALLIGMTIPVLASSIVKNIRVSTGVTVYLDDVKISTKDAAGKSVEPFIHEGTTYLPIRAISDALNVPVTWEPSNQGVYLGKHDKSVVPKVTKDNKLDWVGKYKETYSYAYGKKDLSSSLFDFQYIPTIELKEDGTSTYYMNMYYMFEKFEGAWEIDKNNPNKINISGMPLVSQKVSFVKEGNTLILKTDDCINISTELATSCNNNVYEK